LKCPHCSIHFHDNWQAEYFRRSNNFLSNDVADGRAHWMYQSAYCPGCREWTIQVALGRDKSPLTLAADMPNRSKPRAGSDGRAARNRTDYIEACNVLPISPKASAALSRRCLQNMLHEGGYKARDLAKEIDLLLAETDPMKALPRKLRETVDAIRNFGNFSAHPIDDKTTLQVIDVEPHEAEWCLETIEELFEHFYVGPAAAKAKKAALDAKLAAGGKPPSK
jgi:hypothetical protein